MMTRKKSSPQHPEGQEDQSQSVILPVELFSVSNEASLREPPGLDTSRKLLNNFAIDGFTTGDEPVLIRLQALSMGKKLRVYNIYMLICWHFWFYESCSLG